MIRHDGEGRRARALSVAALSASLLAASPGTAQVLAAPAAPPVNACADVARELVRAKESARECEQARRSAGEQCRSAAADLSQTAAKLLAAESREDSCVAAKSALCSEAAAFAHRLAQGHVTNVGACVASGDQAQLASLVRGWEGATRALAQLGAFSAGETNTLPTVFGASQQERLIARLLGEQQREPLLFRRLLTEALELAAPEAWARIHRGGPPALAAWFASSAPLDADLVAETQRRQGSAAQPSVPALTTALHLVAAYSLVAACSQEDPSHTCARARQLQQLIESTGPLLVRRRIEDIWSTDCGDTGPDLVGRWVEDFPTGQAQSSDFKEIAAASRAKLFTCFLDERKADLGYSAWLAGKLPGPKQLDGKKLARVDEIRSGIGSVTAIDSCARAVHAIHMSPAASTCSAPPAELLLPIETWATSSSSTEDSVAFLVCRQYARLLWEGQAAVIDPSFGHVPTVDSMVHVDPKLPQTSMFRLRHACDERHGSGPAFVEAIRALSRVGGRFGESLDGSPWRVDAATGTPVEAERFSHALTYRQWIHHQVSGESSCAALGLPLDRCQRCMALPRDAFFDCTLERELDDTWRNFTRATIAGLLGILGAVALGVWGFRLRRARRGFREWAVGTQDSLETLGLTAEPDPLRFLYPSRHDSLTMTLPAEPAWERWGARAAVVRVAGTAKVTEADVHYAVRIGGRVGAKVVFLLHDENASLDLGAIRAVLDWASKGGARTMHVLPTPLSRVAWARTATDLLDLIDESSLRGNPFEVRGHITSSNQFWNREQLVSGLLAEARAGRWHVVTGLRRFGKSSLALEVARRLPGPSAYVDLAGFHHEIGFQDDPAQAVDAILRSLCARLSDSARALYPAAKVPEPPHATLDAAELTSWVRALSASCQEFTDGRPPPMLLVLDEIEQALALGPDRLEHALDVLAILLGRLRNAVADTPHPSGSSPVGLLLCSALHPLLWAPLRTLGQQSIMGAFPYLCVPSLGFETAASMMRGLGVRQGIRFTDAALELIVKETQGAPLLLRRLGTSILELYDADRARQGSLGAIQIGIEGAREAVEREEQEGSPLRVWVESEIAEPTSAAGALLRRLAASESAPLEELCALAEQHVMAEFQSSGVARRLPAEEQRRRAQEAARVMLRLLGDTGLLEPIGDLTAPEGYALPDGIIRRVLAVSASPSLRPGP